MKSSIKSCLLYFGLLILLFFIVVLALVFLFITKYNAYEIRGGAMSPNYIEGEYYMSTKISKSSEINRGEVLVISPLEGHPSPNIVYIVRLIGLPGETVSIIDDHVYINGAKLDESEYLSSETKTLPLKLLDDEKEIIIPNDSYFVLGDNRSKSLDSRTFGVVPRDKVKNKILFCYWNCRD